VPWSRALVGSERTTALLRKYSSEVQQPAEPTVLANDRFLRSPGALGGLTTRPAVMIVS
jgi:hypothetical protein